MVDEETGKPTDQVLNLRTQLKDGSEYFENQKEDLSRLWEEFPWKGDGNRGKEVVTFYETGPTKTAKEVCIYHTDRTVLPPYLERPVSCFLCA